MSLEKQKEIRVVEGGRVWPYYEATGIPLLPKKTKCVGVGKCVAIAKKGFCKKDTEHHLLFSKKQIKSYGYPYTELVEHRLLKVEIAECRHNYTEKGQKSYAIHSQYDQSYVPDKAIAYRFMDEARLLKAIESAAVDIHEQVSAGMRTHEAHYSYNRDEKLSRISERFVRSTNKFEYVRSQLDTIEIIPERMVQKELQDALLRRAMLRNVFAENNLDRLPPQLVEAAIEVDYVQAA